ncbi:hypothetical protein [Streptomyces sp. ALI-76-A]|jgi:hypothetical protein|uniref:hypothetical protein n=1 Tax=Streptomyces sp. ALI-76-A TaxID=3025736 RepID=UPI00256F4A13|nr:hypothetical protein [Streptomyces sp. ALI-76-A]MDL5199317.1 hypothetical protein [Streptomyces sp. ALI-76-A]
MRGRTTIIVTAATAALTGGVTLGTLVVDPAAGPGRPVAGSSSAGPVRELTDAERVRVEQAEQRLIERCMRARGFRYWVLPPLDPERLRAFEHPFVRDDVSWAREHGYGAPIQRAFFAAKKRDPNIAYRNGLSGPARARYLTALNGGPDAEVLSVRLPAGGSIRLAIGGCERAAREKLYGDAETYFRADKIATNLNPLYVPKVVRDQRFTEALAAWSHCMRRTTGRAYADPDAVRADLPKRTKGLNRAEADAVEVRLAVAEATCARKSSLGGTARTLDREYGDPVRERYAEHLRTSGRMRLAALAEAERTSTPSN